MTKLLCKREVADMFNVSIKTLELWVSKGYGPRAMKMGRLVRFRNEDVENFINELAGGVE